MPPTLTNVSANATHLLYDGNGGWIEATRVWIEHANEWGWQFNHGPDAVRWLKA